MILTDQQIGGQARKLLTHFDRNGLGYTLDRVTGELLVAEKYDPKVNWTSGVDMNKSSPTYGRPKVLDQYSTEKGGEDVNAKGICPAALGTKDEQPAAYSPDTQLFYVPTNHVCMDYEPFKVSYTAGQPYVGATLSMYPPPGETHMGNFIAWDGKTGKIVWSNKEQFSVWSGALATAGGVVFYGTLEGYLKAVDAKTGKELYKFKTPSGIIGNVTTYEQGGRQYVAVLSGVGGWAGIGLAAGLTDPTAGLGAVGGYAALSNYTALGGTLTVFALPQNEPDRPRSGAWINSMRRLRLPSNASRTSSCVKSGLSAAAMIFVASGGIAFAEGAGDPTAVKSGRRQISRQGRQPDLQGRGRRYGRLVHLLRIPPLSLGMPRLPWPRRDGIDLRAGAEEFAQDHELRRLPRRRRQRPQERHHGAGERHAGVRR